MNLIGIILNFPLTIKHITVDNRINPDYKKIYDRVKEVLRLADSISYNEITDLIEEQAYSDLISLHFNIDIFPYRLHKNKESWDKLQISKKIDLLWKQLDKGMSYDDLHDGITSLKEGKVVLSQETDLSFDTVFTNTTDELIGSTWLNKLDLSISGWIRECWLYIVAWRTGMGKTTLAINMMKNVAQSSRCVYYSYEMTEKQISIKLATSLFEKPIVELKQQHEEYREAWNMFQQDFKIKCNPRYLDDLLADMQTEIGNWVKLFVIDNINNMPPWKKSRQDHMTTICASLKEFCIGNKVAVILLAQINREADKSWNKLPELSQLKHSWALEEYSDCVLLCYREAYYDTDIPDKTFDILIAKNRYWQVKWNGWCTLFWNWSLSLIKNLA